MLEKKRIRHQPQGEISQKRTVMYIKGNEFTSLNRKKCIERWGRGVRKLAKEVVLYMVRGGVNWKVHLHARGINLIIFQKGKEGK